MTIGYGFNTNWIGPEYGFGKSIGEYYEGVGNTVLVVKVCWGGTALESDWRPPSTVAASGGKVCTTYDTQRQSNIESVPIPLSPRTQRWD